MKPDDLTRSASAPARLLVVEDDAGLAELLSQVLREAGFACETAHSGRGALDYFQHHPCDLVLLDYALPDMAANGVVAAARAQDGMPPFIVLTGNGDERVAVELMKSGARDYLIKDTSLLQRLPAVVARVLEEIDVKRRLDEAALALKRNEAELEVVYAHLPLMLLLLDSRLVVRRMNPAAREFAALGGTASGELRTGDLLSCVRSGQGSPCCSSPGCAGCGLRRALLDTMSNGTNHCRQEVKLRLARPGPVREAVMLVSTSRIHVNEDQLLLLCMEDITNQRKLQDRLRQSQKMEAVGQLASGVAHDFNNLLTSILMQVGLMQLHAQLPKELTESLGELEGQAQRASALTRQLLLFGRQQALQVKPLNLNELLETMLKVLPRLLGEQVLMRFNPGTPLPLIQADAGMIEQVILNLCVNARDAMPKGGQLNLATSFIEVRPEDPREVPQARVGRFVRLTVSDTGIGMDEPTIARIFEPFFTTKEVGKGTGLGLATVFGIVQQHNGWIEVESEPGQGSVFSVYLPASDPDEARLSGEDEQTVLGGSETILLVEDEPSVRRSAARVLRGKGYTVHEAGSGPDALAQWEQAPDRIDLLLSDMVMPGGLTGLDLADQFRVRRPGLKVVIFSGYSPDLADSRVFVAKNLAYLPKPCTKESLARIIRKCLDSQQTIPNRH